MPAIPNFNTVIFKLTPEQEIVFAIRVKTKDASGLNCSDLCFHSNLARTHKVVSEKLCSALADHFMWSKRPFSFEREQIFKEAMKEYTRGQEK